MWWDLHLFYLLLRILRPPIIHDSLISNALSLSRARSAYDDVVCARTARNMSLSLLFACSPGEEDKEGASSFRSGRPSPTASSPSLLFGVHLPPLKPDWPCQQPRPLSLPSSASSANKFNKSSKASLLPRSPPNASSLLSSQLSYLCFPPTHSFSTLLLASSPLASSILTSILSHPSYTSSHSLSIYLSLPTSEIQTLPIVRHALSQGKNVFVPWTPPPNKKSEPSGPEDDVRMRMVRVTDADVGLEGEEERFERDKWGIPVVEREGREDGWSSSFVLG
jgi:hypothetical protein